MRDHPLEFLNPLVIRSATATARARITGASKTGVAALKESIRSASAADLWSPSARRRQHDAAWCDAHGFVPVPAAGSPLALWHARLRERPAVAATFVEFEGAAARMGEAASAYASGERQREYRDHRLEWMVKSGGGTFEHPARSRPQRRRSRHARSPSPEAPGD
jgi:hypothetical protein